ncbi:HU family DNA-binding protein [Paenibacillus amylolyticus]|uniref:HU family DNA-binding protein n=1 Tax=Paenibacillus amylolyticus TaxID=1451 RepID=UPI00201D43A0|nr:HU family DNA-binding protein [Paenibacillus amylolyticus]MCL6663424.1 HU family DNA-binding protein [Paenibacillus amylolyticus]
MKNKNLNEHEEELEMEEEDDSQKNAKKYGHGVERKQNYIIAMAAEASGIHPDTVKTAFDTCWAAIQHELEEGNWVKLHGKGTFYLSKRGSRIGRNPATGEEHEVPEREAMAFQTSTAYGKYLREVRAKRSRSLRKESAKSSDNG